MDLVERKEAIMQAQELVNEAMNLVDDAVRGTNIVSNYQAYGKYGFNQLLGQGNPYDSCLENILEDIEVWD